MSDGVAGWYDTNGDGRYDTEVFDANRDGSADGYRQDTDGNSLIDFEYASGDGVPDTVKSDANEDGVADTAMTDIDEDGRFDAHNGPDTAGQWVQIEDAGAVPEGPFGGVDSVVVGGTPRITDGVEILELRHAAETGEVYYGIPDHDSDGIDDERDHHPNDRYQG